MQSKKADKTPEQNMIKKTEVTSGDEEFVQQSVDKQLASNIKNFLVNDYLKDDLQFIPKEQRKFQFYKIDLNGDGNNEIFVRFLTSYFCGSGGCTFLLLDKYGEIITKFTVTREPFWVEQKKENGWAIILVKDSGVFKELKFENGSYPGNPSVLPKAPYDAPSGHAEIIFDENYSKAKTYEF